MKQSLILTASGILSLCGCEGPGPLPPAVIAIPHQPSHQPPALSGTTPLPPAKSPRAQAAELRARIKALQQEKATKLASEHEPEPPAERPIWPSSSGLRENIQTVPEVAGTRDEYARALAAYRAHLEEQQRKYDEAIAMLEAELARLEATAHPTTTPERR
ncbi:hypothetical protein [Luteolibacter sp. LG18]|uniref:hypothetical protein n=1 Tax=Luteolibacter sp. LG18 TaxID=2819286 RepID=UPI002B2EF8B0|nr:hypothetical protein llg_26320 [Luteolibacter sp. LG18]